MTAIDKPEPVVSKQRPLVNVRCGVRRNGRCMFCTSGLKFKKCHGKPPLGPIPTRLK